MTNFNTCERVHGDIEGFFGAIAAAAAEGAGTIGMHETGQQVGPFGFGKVLGLEVGQPFLDRAVSTQSLLHRPELQLPLS